MKIRRNILFRLSIFLLGLVWIVNPLNIGIFPSRTATAQSSPRPYVVFVNGYQDCCTWGRHTDKTPDPFINTPDIFRA